MESDSLFLGVARVRVCYFFFLKPTQILVIILGDFDDGAGDEVEILSGSGEEMSFKN